MLGTVCATDRSLLFVRISVALLVLGVIGGFVFEWLERDEELARVELNRVLYRSLVGSVDFQHCHDPAFEDLGFCRRHRQLEAQLRLFFERAGNSLEDPGVWTWLGSFCFVFHLSSTVGYATQGAPATSAGQLAAIAFGVIGVPLFGAALLMTSRWMLSAARHIFGWLIGSGTDTLEERSQLLRLAMVLAVVMWLGAALLFKILEGWSYARSLFFCFVTFTTIGIGNDVPTTALSRVCCLVYIYTSLSLSVGLAQALSKNAEDKAHVDPEEEHTPLITNALPYRQATAIAAAGWPARRWAQLCAASVLLLCLCGGAVFPGLERDEELRRYERSRSLYRDLGSLAEFEGCDKDVVRHMDFCRNMDWFRARLLTFFGPDTPNSMVDRHRWTTVGSASFVLSLASTIGYGSQSPHTREGKLATVIFGLLSVPLFGYCMLTWSASFRFWVRRALERGGAQIAASLELAGIVAGLWLIGAAVFCAVEGWSYPTALYFCFVTLSAVGFANVTPATLPGKVLVLVYIGVGLTSVASLMSEVIGRFTAAISSAEVSNKFMFNESNTSEDPSRRDEA